MSRVYSTDEFEEAILANNPGCYLTLKQLGQLSTQDNPPRKEESSDSDFYDELKVEAMFQKLNPRPLVPGELMKPEPLFYDMEIRQLIKETREMELSQGKSTVLSGGIKAPSPLPKPLKKKKKKSNKTSSNNEGVFVVSSSSESVEIVEDPQTANKRVINPAALKFPKMNSSKQTQKSSSKKDVITISSEENTDDIPKKFFSPREVYEMKMKSKHK